MQSIMQNQNNTFKNELTNDIKNMMASFFQINTASFSGSGSLPSNTIANPKGELKAIITRSGIVLDGPSVLMPHPFINPKEDERTDETLTDLELVEYTIKYQKMLKAFLYKKEKLLELANTPLNENCSAVILKKLPEKLGDPGKFLISCSFSELQLQGLSRSSASINLTATSVSKSRKVHFLPISSSVILNSIPRVPLILGRPFLRTARALIDMHGEELILYDGDERLILNMKHGTSKGLVNYSLEEFADELALIESFPSGNDDMTLEDENKIKVSKLLVDELDSTGSSSFLPHFLESDSVLYEDFSKVETLTSTDNEDKVFNQGILVHDNLYEVTNRVTPVKNVKKISSSNASLILEDYNPPFF
ncbi:hypothetical protein Tco_0024761 [Tanacetum coccineum]